MMREKIMQEQMIKEKIINEQKINDSLKIEDSKLKNIENNSNTTLSLLNEFKNSLVFFFIFIILNIVQVNNFVCNTLKIENNNIFVLLKGFIATILFFFSTKIINKFI